MASTILMAPVLRSLRGYRARWLGFDLIAGLTLAAIAIPEQMATARLGGLPPQIGFYAFIAAGLAFLVFGASGRLSAGADSTITPIFAGALALVATAGSPHYLALAAALAVMVGVIVGIAGLARLGWIGNLLSGPVALGFLAGIAVHIAISQLPAALGLAPPSGSALARIAALAGLAPHAAPLAMAVSGGMVAVVAAAHRISPRLPGALVAVILASLAAAALGLGARGLALLGPVAGGLPALIVPTLAPGELLRLAPLALLVSLVVMVQTAATTKAFPPPQGPADAGGDFIGMGAANLAAGLFGAFPVNASPPRTAIAAESGGRSQITGLVAVTAVTALSLFGAPLLRAVPQAALSGVLLFVAARLVRVRDIAAVVVASPAEAGLIAVTAAAIICLPIESGVAVGVVLSLLNGITAQARARVTPMGRIPGTSVWWPLAANRAGETTPDLAVVAFQAPLNFLNADAFAAGMLTAVGADGVRLVVLEAAGVLGIDYTAGEAVRRVVAACAQRRVRFALARLESVAAQHALTRLGLRQLIGPDHIFDSVAAAVAALDKEGA
jgi:MFS superfamily sulfate permease-like transporter